MLNPESFFRKITIVLDEVGSFLGEGSSIERIPSRTARYRVTRHMRGGQWGMLVYPDGLVLQAGRNDIIHRRDDEGRFVDRIRARDTSTGVRFITWGEFKAEESNFKSTLEMAREEMIRSGCHGMMGSGFDHLIYFPPEYPKATLPQDRSAECPYLVENPKEN